MVAVVKHQVDELGQRSSGPDPLAGGDSFEGECRVGGRSQSHERVYGTLELHQEVDASAIEGVHRPDHARWRPCNVLFLTS